MPHTFCILWAAWVKAAFLSSSLFTFIDQGCPGSWCWAETELDSEQLVNEAWRVKTKPNTDVKERIRVSNDLWHIGLLKTSSSGNIAAEPFPILVSYARVMTWDCWLTVTSLLIDTNYCQYWSWCQIWCHKGVCTCTRPTEQDGSWLADCFRPRIYGMYPSRPNIQVRLFQRDCSYL